MERRTFLGVAGATLAGVAGYGTLVEPRLLGFSEHAVRLGRTGPRAVGAGEPRASEIVAVQISDLHLKRITDLHADLADRVDRLRPDLLLFTGDTVDARENLPLVREFLGLLANDAPRVAIMGNWEYWGGITQAELGGAFASAGGELLVNRSLSLRFDAGELLLTGLDDWVGGHPDLPLALRDAGGSARDAGHHVLLSHCPIVRDVVPDLVREGTRDEVRDGTRDEVRNGTRDDPGGAVGSPPWMLSGHTHGGQVSVLGMHYLPRGSGSYVEGWYGERLPRLYVSRGVGTSVVPVRIGAPPEVAVFRISLA